MAGKAKAIPRGSLFPRVAPWEVGAAALLVVLFGLCLLHQKHYYADWAPGSGKYYQKVNIPKPEVVRVASLGYDNFVGNLLTLRAVQMFGAAWETPDKSSEPIYNYFDVVTELDPHFIELYEFANLVLSDDRGAYDLGLDMLRKGIGHNPGNWRLAYLGIYTAIWDMGDPEVAREFVAFAKEADDVPGYVLRMEEYVERRSGRFEAAFEVNLRQMVSYKRTDAVYEIDITRRRFENVLDKWYRHYMNESIDRFLEEEGRLPASMEELVQSGLMAPFDAPVMERVEFYTDLFLEEGRDLDAEFDTLRLATLEPIVGLPPDPRGTWYFIDTELLAEFEAGLLLPPSDSPSDRYPFVTTMAEAVEAISPILVNVRQTLNAALRGGQEWVDDSELLDPLIRGDGYGGHYYYVRQRPNPDGTTSHHYTSTMFERIRGERDPRMGLRGMMGNWPPRPIRIPAHETPYLETEPSIWDFEEDIQWAASEGLVPGKRYEEQPEAIRARVEGREPSAAALPPIVLMPGEED